MGLLLLVRHGQASFGADDYDVLSQTGWAQGRRLGEALTAAGAAPGAWVIGGMRRHRETYEATGLPEAPRIDARWDEFDHLSVVAVLPEVVAQPDLLADRRGFQQAFEQATARWIGGEHDGEYAESWPQFVARVREGFHGASGLAGRGATVGVVSSGGPIALVAAMLVAPGADDATLGALWARFNTVAVNSAVTRVLVGSTGVRLLTFNEHTHLAADEVTYR